MIRADEHARTRPARDNRNVPFGHNENCNRNTSYRHAPYPGNGTFQYCLLHPSPLSGRNVGMSSDEFPQGLSKMNARPQTTEPTKRPAESVSLEEYLPHRLSVVSRLVTALLQKCYADSFGLTIAEWKILTIVGHGSPISPTAVGGLADMDKVQVSRSSASLMDRGFLSQNPERRTRTPAETDPQRDDALQKQHSGRAGIRGDGRRRPEPHRMGSPEKDTDQTGSPSADHRRNIKVRPRRLRQL